jgi:hypothetical protein
MVTSSVLLGRCVPSDLTPYEFRFGFTGTPIDKTMQSTHRDFGPLKDRRYGSV